MRTYKPIGIPVVAADVSPQRASACEGYEQVVLRVLGDSMEPEFTEGEILIIEMGRPARPGDFVIAEIAAGEFLFRQLLRDDQGSLWLHALNPLYPDLALSGLACLKGVVTHKRNARSRRSLKSYVA